MVAMLGIGVSVATGFAVVTWLGLVGGVAAIVAAYLVYRIANRMADSDERTRKLSQQVDQLEEAVANQIQARMSAEENARQAKLWAADAERPDSLAKRSGEVADGENLTDTQTGLFGESYFLANVEQRISAARRHLRPVAVALIEVVVDPKVTPHDPVDANLVSLSLADTLRDADTACRLADGRFAIILEDTPENGAIWTIERLRRHLTESTEHSTLWAGVSCYPAHGFDTGEILAQAEQALIAARDWPQDRIEVAEAR